MSSLYRQRPAISMEAKIIKALGGRRAFGAKRIDLLAEVKRGLPAKAYVALAKTLALTAAEQDRLLQVSHRTRVRWRQRNRLDQAVSGRLIRIARILALATEVLEHAAHAIAWLREPSDVLRGRTPLQAISIELGAEKVTGLLNQMERGVYS
jgi:putative toxin-antitoxin system antitoxin component (TIGR02293 family)